ncbi:MAG: MoaD/ThiS family protein [Candidatus Bathyarchaeia archaeon]
MRVKVSVSGIPTLRDAIGSKMVELDCPGRTIRAVIDSFLKLYGQRARKILLDERGKLDPSIQVSLNHELIIPHDHHDMTSHEGDEIGFLILVSGG